MDTPRRRLILPAGLLAASACGGAAAPAPEPEPFRRLTVAVVYPSLSPGRGRPRGGEPRLRVPRRGRVPSRRRGHGQPDGGRRGPDRRVARLAPAPGHDD